MLDEFTQKDLEILRNALTSFWGDDCDIESVEVIDAPMPMFEIKFILYKQVGAGLYYDRGALDIAVCDADDPRATADDPYVLLKFFTEKDVVRGFKAMQPEIMQHNFSVLDEVAKQLAFGK